jgi:hypothetical protein
MSKRDEDLEAQRTKRLKELEAWLETPAGKASVEEETFRYYSSFRKSLDAPNER